MSTAINCVVNQDMILDEIYPKIHLSMPLAYDNAFAHAMRITAFDRDKNPADLTGVGVVGNFKRSNDTTVTPILGTVTGNVGEILLPPSCYVVPGRFTFTMNLTQLTDPEGVDEFDATIDYEKGDLVVNNGVVWRFTADHDAGAWTGSDAVLDGITRSSMWVEGHVEKNISGDIVDPGTPVGNIEQAIGNATAAATAAQSAATEASQAAAAAEQTVTNFAPAFDAATANAAGDYVTYTDGKLYLLPEGHTAGTSWANTTHTETDFGAEVSDLKSHLVEQSEDPPTSPNNRIWFPSATPEGVEVPTFEEFSEVKSALGQTDASVMPSVSAFLAGAENIDFTTATQTWGENANRVGNDDIFVAANDIVLDVNSGYRFIVFYFTDADVYSSNSGWKTERYTIKAGSHYSLEMSKTDTVKPMSVEEATALYEVSLPNTLNKFAYAYDVAEKTDLALPYREYTDATSGLTWASGYYQNGTSTYVSNQDYQTASVDLAAGEMLRITGESNYNCRLYCVFVNGTPSDVFPTASNNNTYSNILYVAPVACTVYIGRAVNDAGTKVETVAKQYRYIWDYIQPNSLAGKTWLCMGDSITYNTAATNAGNKNYFELIAERTGVVPTGAGRTGTGYTKDSGGYSKFVTRISVITTVYDIFTIFGSTNDQAYAQTDDLGSVTDGIEADTYMGYVNAAIDAVYATGNYHLGIISPIPWNANGGNPQYALSGRRMANALRDVCQYRGVPYLDLFRSSNMRPWVTDFKNAYVPDGTHPNQAGYEIFTPRIEAFIRSL